MLSNKGLEAYLLELDSSWGIGYFLVKDYNDPFLWRRGTYACTNSTLLPLLHLAIKFIY